MRAIRSNQRGVVNWLWALFGVIVVVALIVAGAYFQTLIITVILLLGGFGVIAFGPKPYAIWVGLGIIILAVVLYIFTAGHTNLVL